MELAVSQDQALGRASRHPGFIIEIINMKNYKVKVRVNVVVIVPSHSPRGRNRFYFVDQFKPVPSPPAGEFPVVI